MADVFSFTCPYCQKPFTASPQYLGKVVYCPACDGRSTLLVRKGQWKGPWKSLRIWFRVFLVCWLGGLIALVCMMRAEPTGTFAQIVGFCAFTMFLGSPIPWIVTMVFAYRVQKGLYEAGLITSSPWYIVAAGLLLNPYVVGFYPILSVSWAAQRAAAREGSDKLPASQATS